MVNLYISRNVEIKLREKHCVSRADVIDCFANREKSFIEDNRSVHQTDPKTQWFVAQNNMGKNIKVVFMLLPNGTVLLKTAYVANKDEIRIYDAIAKQL